MSFDNAKPFTGDLSLFINRHRALTINSLLQHKHPARNSTVSSRSSTFSIGSPDSNLVQDSEISGPINVVLEDKIKRLTGDVERLIALAKNDSNTIKLQQVRIRYLMKKIAKMKGATKIREEILVLEERLEAGRKKNEDELLVLQEQRDVINQQMEKNRTYIETQ